MNLLDRGFVYAIAHVRGGQELGRDWYENGKLLKKKNTFYDFIDVGKYLIEKKYAGENRLYAHGGSAGGLLVGAVINMAPELFHGAIADVPFVDVMTTMLDDSIPLTTGEYDEWGNPNVKEYYDYMLSYSSLRQRRKESLPEPSRAGTGLNDSQVQYWEPAKWVAKITRHENRQERLTAKNQHGRRPRRSIGPVRSLQRNSTSPRFSYSACWERLKKRRYRNSTGKAECHVACAIQL